MAVGRFVSDLESGDILPPVNFIITPAASRLFCHGFEEDSEWFHGAGMDGRQYAPPTFIHSAKMRLLKSACPGGGGPHPKLITEYDAMHHNPIPVGELLTVSGKIAQRYEKRGRQYIFTEVDLRLAEDGRPLIAYSDTMLLRFSALGEDQA